MYSDFTFNKLQNVPTKFILELIFKRQNQPSKSFVKNQSVKIKRQNQASKHSETFLLFLFQSLRESPRSTLDVRIPNAETKFQ